jgi:ATP-dependent DNA helicase RecQ
MSFNFDMSQFVHVFKLSKITVDSCLRLLQQCGYISYSEDVNNPSRLMFIVGRDDLYRYRATGTDDNIIKFVLRTTSGVFSEYRPIDEALIARTLGITRDTVYECMKKLNHDHIISYIPQNTLPQIYFNEERLPAKSLYFGPEHYLDRRKLYVDKINAVIGYATDFKCRVQQLLHYFGMTDVPMCGTCDVCTSRHETDMTEYEFNNLSTLICKHITTSPTQLHELPDRISKEQGKVSRVARWLIENEKMTEGENGFLKINKDL